jgi:ABC-2 type transport system permease protein
MAETTSLARVAAAFLRRDLAIQAASPIGFLTRIGGLAVALGTVGLMARFVGGEHPGGFAGFWLVGIALAEFFRVVATAPARKLREAQLEGTLLAMLSTPAPSATVVLCAPLAEFVIGLAELAIVLPVGAALLGVHVRSLDPLALLAALLLSLVAFAALGLVGGALTIFLRRTDPVTMLVSLAGALIGGVFFPLDVMPPVLRAVAWAFPLGPSLEAMRAVLLQGAGLAELGRSLLALGVFSALVAPLGAALFTAALRRARIDGSLGHF